MGDLLQCLGNLIHIALVFGIVALICIGLWHLPLTKFDGSGPGGEAVPRPCRGQLGKSADISRVKLLYLDGLAALKHIELSDLLLHILIRVVDHVVRLEHAGVDLDQRIFSDKGIHDGLPDVGRFGPGEIVIRMVNIVGL